MAEIDPRLREFEREAAKLLAAMKRSAKRADAYSAEVDRGRASRRQLDERIRQEVASDRIKGETVEGRTPRSLEEQSRASRRAADETDRLTRANEKAAQVEQRAARQRVTNTRTMLSREEAIRRYGPAAGNKYIERQAASYYDQRPQTSREEAIRRYGPAAGGKYFDRLNPPAPPAPPPPPTAGGAAGGGGDEGFRRRLAEEQANTEKLNRSIARSTLEHKRLIQVQASGSNVLRRNGALTTEFIQASARGEVTIRELGYQTASTIGKFGGWITAGAAIYSALGAVERMGRGALGAYSGVNQLQRVVNDVDASKLRTEFSQLADYFQLPFEDVTEGVYEVGKVFHDQNTALEASKALLYSVRVGELDTATAGRYLISITNAYNLSAQDLNSTFDKFNQLQNNYGVAIAGTEAATARAAGSFVNAGGSLDYLISLIGTAARVTGAAPERIGTALQRAPTFIHKPDNEQILKSFGIDPSQNIDEIFNQAFAVAQKSSGKRRRQLAAALFGPQYGAGVGTPLLRQAELFKRIQKSVANSEGSGARELAKLKRSPEEQLKNIGVQLERLGGNLADSGLLSGMATFVLTLDDALRLANNLLGAFNELPEPLRQSLAILVQAGVAARVLGRLNIGGFGGERREARLIRKGLYDEKGTLEQERERAAGTATEQQSRAISAENRARQESLLREKLVREGADDEKRIAQSKARERVYLQEAATSREEALRADLDQETKAKRLEENQGRIAQGRKRFGRLNVRGQVNALRGGGYAPTSFDVPTTTPPAQVGLSEGQRQVRAAAAMAESGLTPQQFAAQERALSRAERESQASARRSTRLKGAAGRFSGAANRMIGGMGNILFAAFTVGVVAELLTQQAAKVGEKIESIASGTSSAKDEARKLRSLTGGEDSLSEDLTDFFTGEAIQAPLHTLSGGIIPEFEGVGDKRRDIEQLTAARLRLIRRTRAKAKRQGGPVPFRYAGDIQKDIEELQSGDQPTRKAQRLLARYRQELSQSMEAIGQASGSSKQQQARLKAAEAALRQSKVTTAQGPKALAQALSALQPKEIQERLDAEVSQTDRLGGLTPERINRIKTAYAVQSRKLAGSSDPKDIQALGEARQSYYDGLQSSIENELDHALALARTPGRRNEAYARAFSQLRNAYVGGADAAVDRQAAEVKKLQRQLHDPQSSRQLGVIGSGFGARLGFRRVRPDLDKLRQRLRGEKDQLRELRSDQREKRAFFREVQQQLREQQYEENAALREAQTNLRVSRTADPLAQAKIRLQAVNTEIGRAIDVYGRSSKEVMELLAQRQEILSQKAQDQLNLIDAQGAVRAAGLAGEGNETARAQVELRTLQQKLAFERGHANRFDPAEILQLQAEVREAQISLQEQIEQEAEELALAAIDIRIARAEAGGNDVRAARLNVSKAQYELGHADTKVERRQARADLIGKRASLRDARVQRAIEDVEFEADIGKLTLDQQISAYQRILHTQRLTRDARRDLRRKIYALRHETEDEGQFELNVGNIKLPTVYEIRRAVQGGVTGRGVTVSQSNTFHINGADDPKAVASEINRLNGGANKAALRSAGVRG